MASGEQATVYDETVREGLKAAAEACRRADRDYWGEANDLTYDQLAPIAVAAFLRAFDPGERFAPRLLADIAEEMGRAG